MATKKDPGIVPFFSKSSPSLMLNSQNFLESKNFLQIVKIFEFASNIRSRRFVMFQIIQFLKFFLSPKLVSVYHTALHDNIVTEKLNGFSPNF